METLEDLRAENVALAEVVLNVGKISLTAVGLATQRTVNTRWCTKRPRL